MENNVELTVNDLEVVVQIIDAVTSRGAIRGEEMLAVGSLREKFVKILASFKEDKPEDAAEDIEITKNESEAE